MGVFSLLISLFFLVFCILKFKNRILHPSILFFGLWTFILFLSNLNLYNINKPTYEAYFLISLMLIFFFVGCYLENVFSKKINIKSKISTKIQKKINIKYKLIYLLLILLLIFTVIDCVIVIKGINDGVPMWQIRRWGMGRFGVDNNPMIIRRTFVEEVFRSVVLSPFSTIVTPIAIYLFFNSKKRKHSYILFAISLMLLILSSFAGGGGRLGFINYVGCFLLAFLIFTDKSKFQNINTKKYIKYLIIFVIVSLLIVVGYTTIRTGAGNFVKQTYTYFALPPTLLSNWLPTIHEANHTYGLLTFFGIHSYFFRVFETLGINFMVPSIYSDVFQHILNAENFLEVGYGVANAFVTPVYYFFIDGGYFFVCLASMFFGYIVSKFYKNFINNINIKTFTYYFLVMYGVFITFMRIQTAIPSYVLSYFFAHVLLTSYKRKKE